jgi:alkyl sulfatase BDS1-like metallo-beta-lactamase superfamily hydrolase
MTSGKVHTTIVNVRAEEEVLMLASQGYSLNEIVEKLKLPKSVVNLLST